MGWIRLTRRSTQRNHQRPDIETLEVRTLLSTSPAPTTLPAVSLKPSSAHPAGASNTDAFGTNYDAIIGASAARQQYGVNGSGMTVAVIDAGVNYNNAALGGGFGSGHKVVAGWDFADNNGDPSAKTMDHGTAVAGLIASSDPNHLGVAPGADIASLRVFNDQNQGNFSLVANALQWVIDNHSQYNITAVNLSVADGGNYASNWFSKDGGVGQQITSLIGKLDALNIPVVVAAGNSFSGQQGMGFPAIVSDAISVTSTDASGQLVSNAQRLGTSLGGASATKIAAPGQNDYAPSSGNTFSEVSGTSFSTPLVTGAVVLLQQVYEQRFHTLPTVQQIDNWLQQGSDPINDPATGTTIGQLDIPKAIAQIPDPALQTLSPPSTGTSASTTPPVNTPTQVDTLVPPPATTPTPAPAPTSTSGVQLWINGQSLNGLSASGLNTALSGFPSWFSQSLQSLQNWWPSPGDNGTQTVQVWNANPPGSPQTAGEVSVNAAQPAGTHLVHFPQSSSHKVTHVHHGSPFHPQRTPVHHGWVRSASPFVGARRVR